MTDRPTILAIESSCDDTSIAILQNTKVLSNIAATQKVHELYGGVVPELASRDHLKHIIPVLEAALSQAKITLQEIDAIAVTQGPGLIGSLMVGTSFAKSLSIVLQKPIIAVHHMHAHIMAHFIDQPLPTFPFLCLTVSGGHTQMVKVTAPLQFEIIGNTLDDAAGEAFDKGAKLLNLPYPGGPLIDKLAKEGDENKFTFPKTKVEGLHFSYSGLKSALLYFLKDKVKQNPNFIEDNIADLCASYQKAVLDQLIDKLLIACKTYNITCVGIAGGVSANSKLRALISELQNRGFETHIPSFSYCTDNAAMIGITAHYMYLQGKFSSLDFSPNANLSF